MLSGIFVEGRLKLLKSARPDGALETLSLESNDVEEEG